MHNRVHVKFRLLDKPKEDQFTLELSRKMSYEQVTGKLSEKLNCDPLKLRLTVHNTYTDQPKAVPIKRSEPQTLREMLTIYNSQQIDILYFEELEMSIVEFETKRQLKVAWHNLKTEEVKVHNLLLPKESAVEDIFMQLRGLVVMETTNKRMRLLETWNNKVQKVYDPADPISNINEYTMHNTNTLRCEEMPDEELQKDPSSKQVYVTHFSRNPPLTHFFGVPFVLFILQTETAAQVKARIKAKLQISDEEFSKWKLAIVSYAKPETLQDDEVILARPFHQGDFLGLEHADTSHKHTQRTYEKPVKIYN